MSEESLVERLRAAEREGRHPPKMSNNVLAQQMYDEAFGQIADLFGEAAARIEALEAQHAERMQRLQQSDIERANRRGGVW